MEQGKCMLRNEEHEHKVKRQANSEGVKESRPVKRAKTEEASHSDLHCDLNLPLNIDLDLLNKYDEDGDAESDSDSKKHRNEKETCLLYLAEEKQLLTDQTPDPDDLPEASASNLAFFKEKEKKPKYQFEKQIYLVGPTPEFLKEKAENIIKYTKIAYPDSKINVTTKIISTKDISFRRLRPREFILVKDFCTEEKIRANPDLYGYAIRLDTILPPLLQFLFRAEKCLYYGDIRRKGIEIVGAYECLGVAHFVAGHCPYIYRREGERGVDPYGLNKSSAKDLSAGDLIFIKRITSPGTYSYVAFVYIDDDLSICLSTVAIHKDHPNIVYPTRAMGNWDIRPTAHILSDLDLTLENLKSGSERIEIYKKDNKLRFSEEALSFMLEYYQWLTRNSTAGINEPQQNFQHNPMVSIIKKLKMLYTNEENDIARKILKEIHKQFRKYYKAVAQFIDLTENEYYTILRLNYRIYPIDYKASSDQIRAAYKKLSVEYHPDKNPENEEEFKRISTAYTVLSDADERRKYDEEQGFREKQEPSLLSRFFRSIYTTYQNSNLLSGAPVPENNAVVLYERKPG
jgi:hypothetical protein